MICLDSLAGTLSSINVLEKDTSSSHSQTVVGVTKNTRWLALSRSLNEIVAPPKTKPGIAFTAVTKG